MKKRILALLMALVMVFGLNTTFLAAGSPVGDNGAKAIYVEWVMEKNLSTWNVKCENILGENISRADYMFKIYRDGELVNYSWTHYYAEEYEALKDQEMVEIDLSDSITESGTYYVELKATAMTETVNEFGGISYITDATYEGSSSTATYTDPGKSLAVPANVAISNEGMITFDLVDGAEYYEIELMYYGKWDGEYGKYWTTFTVIPEAGAAQGTYNLLEWLKSVEQDYDEDYTVSVRAYSPDINVIKNSDWSEQSNRYEFKISAEQAQKNLEEALKSENPGQILGAMSNASSTALNEVLKNNKAMISEIAKAEAAWIAERGDGVANTVTNVCDIAGMDASKISIVGALYSGFYADAEKIDFSVKTSTADVTIPEGLSNVVKLDIELLFDGVAAKELYAPIIITMPIPANVTTEKLVILHYHGDKMDTITPIVNEDGTMTFVVDGFSTFVVANDIPEAANNGGTDNGKESGGTGDNTPVEVLVGIMLLSAVVAVVALKKKSVVK